MKRIIISGGGTGGHIYPALTIARELEKLEPVEILFVGTPNSMEAEIIPKEGYRFASLPAYGLKRKLTMQNFKVLMKTVGNLFKAHKILKGFHPDVVIGTGGYVCGPILLVAALEQVPTIIQEQNVIPGITNKALSRFVDCVALGYEEARKRFPCPDKCIYTGNPIRDDIVNVDRIEARKELGVEPDTFMVVIAGGSRGARTINKAMIGVHKHFKELDDVCLYHITGQAEYEQVLNDLHVEVGYYGKGSRIVEYEYRMPTVLAAADLVIYRAGAIGLAELAARGVPSIIIPYPYAAEDHQTYNARAFVAAGASKMIVDAYLQDKELIQDIENLRNNVDEIENMSEATKKLRKVHAGKEIASIALELAK